MKMKKLLPVDIIQPSDFIKLKSNSKAVPVSLCQGFKVGSIDLFMDVDFEGFFRPA